MADSPPNEDREESGPRPRPLSYLSAPRGRSQLRDLLRDTGVQPYESSNFEPDQPYDFAGRFPGLAISRSLSGMSHTNISDFSSSSSWSLHEPQNRSILGNSLLSSSRPRSPLSRPPSPSASRDRAPGRGLQQELDAEFSAMVDDLLAPWQNNPDYEELDQFVDETVDEDPASVPGPPIDTLPQRRLTAADKGDDGMATCYVCMENVAIGTIVTQLDCPHWFCTDCLQPWLALKNTCPTCRAQIEGHGRP